MLKLMYITNRPEVAHIAELSGVDRIFVDLETIGKQERQGGMDTVQSHHTLDDVAVVGNSIDRAELLVRSNPIHPGSRAEIDTIVSNGADVIMLPYFKTVNEAAKFIDLVAGRAKTSLLVETAEAVEQIDAILSLEGIDEIHIGLNDLHLAYGMKFMFELLTDGTVERLGCKILARGIPYGFGGIARLGAGALPSGLRGRFCRVASVTPIRFVIRRRSTRYSAMECARSERWKPRSWPINSISRRTDASFAKP